MNNVELGYILNQKKKKSYIKFPAVKDIILSLQKTDQSVKKSQLLLILHHTNIPRKYFLLHTSTKALNLRSSFEVMWRASEWKGELSPTKISVRHFRLFSPSVMSGRLQVGKTKLQNLNIYSQFYLRRFYNMHTKKFQWRSSYGIVFTY